MDDITMTSEELETIQRELIQLETIERREIAARIKTAREWGDLKENAEYHAAKEDQGKLEARIRALRQMVRSAEVVTLKPSSETVQHGSTVTFTDRATQRQQTSKIVSPHDARPAEGTLSAISPVAKALIGRGVGDVVEVETPAGVRSLQVDAIS